MRLHVIPLCRVPTINNFMAQTLIKHKQFAFTTV